MGSRKRTSRRVVQETEAKPTTKTPAPEEHPLVKSLLKLIADVNDLALEVVAAECPNKDRCPLITQIRKLVNDIKEIKEQAIPSK